MLPATIETSEATHAEQARELWSKDEKKHLRPGLVHRREYGLSRAEKGYGAQESALAWCLQGLAYPGRQAASPAVALQTGGRRANASPDAPSAAGTAASHPAVTLGRGSSLCRCVEHAPL